MRIVHCSLIKGQSGKCVLRHYLKHLLATTLLGVTPALAELYVEFCRDMRTFNSRHKLSFSIES